MSYRGGGEPEYYDDDEYYDPDEPERGRGRNAHVLGGSGTRRLNDDAEALPRRGNPRDARPRRDSASHRAPKRQRESANAEVERRRETRRDPAPTRQAAPSDSAAAEPGESVKRRFWRFGRGKGDAARRQSNAPTAGKSRLNRIGAIGRGIGKLFQRLPIRRVKQRKDDAPASPPSAGRQSDNRIPRRDSAAAGAFGRASPEASNRAESAPVFSSGNWLELDRKLDLIGVALVFGAIALVFSALSQEQAAVSAFNQLIGQLLGWGAMALPLTMLCLGLWLMARRFGDSPPTIDPLRLAGAVVAYLGALTFFQFIEALNYGAFIARIGVCGGDCMWTLVQGSYQAGRGGGYVGGWLYQALVSNFTEIGGFVLTLMTLTFALMLLTRLSMAELAGMSLGMARGVRGALAQKAAQRRARRLQLGVAETAADAAHVRISKPDPAMLPGDKPERGALPRPSGETIAMPTRFRAFFARGIGQAKEVVQARVRPQTSSAAASAQDQARAARRDAQPPEFMTSGQPVAEQRGGMPRVNGGAAAASSTTLPPSRPAVQWKRPKPPTFAAAGNADAASIAVPESVAAAPDSAPVAPAIAPTPSPKAYEPPPAPKQPQPVQSPPSPSSSRPSDWQLPDYRALLSAGSTGEMDAETLNEQAFIIEETLRSFGAPGTVVEMNTGPVITQFGVQPQYLEARKGGKRSRVKVSAIAQLDKDLQLALGAKSIRIEAPVPGKGYVGIEVPNPDSAMVGLRDVMDSQGFRRIGSPLAIALGKSVDGKPISADLTDMPHLLIAGTTGSGKSSCINAIIISILANHSPDEVKFIMVDPKRVELTGYNGLPHLVAPVVVELERTVGVLRWVTREMDQRYKTFSQAGARNIIDYNHMHGDSSPMPYIVVIIDELADLMMTSPEETERAISRIAALARATGIHLVIATQRPSVDVVTGLIKANFPARIAFAVAGSVDSRVILDQPGAERLLGKGDMLYLSGDAPAPIRMQGVFVSDDEIKLISRFWKLQGHGITPNEPISLPPAKSNEKAAPAPVSEATVEPAQGAFWELEADADLKGLGDGKASAPDTQEDELYQTAVDMVRRLEKASISLLQRRLRIGYGRAARLMDMMEERGIVGPPKEGSSKPRDVLPGAG